MTSIADLRARLKKASAQPSKLRITNRTAIDLILKLNREGHIVPPLIFTSDGQEVLSQKILQREILEYLETDGRARISEIARALSVSPDLVESRGKGIGSLTMYLDEVIANEWFMRKSEEVHRWLDREGQLQVTAIGERLSLSLDLVRSRILDRFVLCDSDTITSPNFVKILQARTRGYIHASSTPRELKLIATEVGGDVKSVSEIIQGILARDPIGTFGNDGVYVPNSWAKSRGDQALASWRDSDWCEVDALRLAVGQTGMAVWKSQEGLIEGRNCLTCASKYIIRLNGKLKQTILAAKMSSFVISMMDILTQLAMPRDLSQRDLERLAALAAGETGWNISGLTIYSPDLLDKVFDALNISESVTDSPELDNATSSLCTAAEIILEADFHVSDSVLRTDIMTLFEGRIRTAVREEIQKREQIRLKPSVKHELDSLSSLEDHILDSVWNIAEAQEAIERCGVASDSLGEELRDRLVIPLLNDVFKYTAVRLCGFELNHNVATESDRTYILRAVPNSISADDVRNALRILESMLCSPADVSVDRLREELSQLSLVVPKSLPRKKSVNKRKHLELLKQFISTASNDLGFITSALSLAIFAASGKRISVINEKTSLAILRGISHSLRGAPEELIVLVQSACDVLVTGEPIPGATREAIKKFISAYDN